MIYRKFFSKEIGVGQNKKPQALISLRSVLSNVLVVVFHKRTIKIMAVAAAVPGGQLV